MERLEYFFNLVLKKKVLAINKDGQRRVGGKWSLDPLLPLCPPLLKGDKVKNHIKSAQIGKQWSVNASEMRLVGRGQWRSQDFGLGGAKFFSREARKNF